MNGGVAAARYEELLRRMPKVELHCHFLGTMRAETCADLVQKHGVRLPDDARTIYAHINSRSDPGPRYAHTKIPVPGPNPAEEPDPSYSLLEVSQWVAAALVEPADFARVAYEGLEDAAKSSTIRYREMFFEPTLYYPHGVRYRTIVDGIGEGIRAAEADFGIRCQLIAGINREDTAAVAVQLVQEVLDNRRDEVIGIGLEAFELSGPPEKFVDAYQLAKSGGLHRTAHAAEHDPSARNVVTCLDLLGCERIDHGYFVLEDDAVVDRCRDEGVYFACISTTSRRAWRPWRRKSIKAMVERGLRVTLASDDPAMFPTTLSREYLIAGTELGFGPATMREICLNGIEASWLDEADKRRMRRQFTSEIAALEAQLQAPPVS